MEASFPLLTVLIWLPVFGGLAVIAFKNLTDPRWIALGVALATFLASLPLAFGFDTSFAGLQFVERASWIAAFNIEYYLGVDGIAMPLVLLTTFTTVIVIIAGWDVIKERTAEYMAAFLIQGGVMVGAFAAADAVLFYVFWEAILIPMFLIIGIWGGERRIYATLKFFLYTFLGSVFMLVALIYLYSQAGSFEVAAMHKVPLTINAQVFIFIAFLLAFAVKVPMWPVHTWLPDAHVEAPTGGSVVLAAVMLKLGGYGFIRYSMPIAPDASELLATMMIGLSLVAIVYIGFVALVQPDMKKLIAYSSISHMGFCTLGFFIVFQMLGTESVTGVDSAGPQLALQGGMVQMISHGFISGAMFLCVGVLYDRLHSRQIGDYGGVVNSMPVFAAFMMLFAMANSGLPGTSGFVGEFMVVLGAFQASFWVAFLAGSTLVLGAGYSLWMYKRVIFGNVANEGVANLTDINAREGLLLAVLAIAVLGLGLWPAPLLDAMGPTLEALLEHLSQSKLPLS